MTDGHVQVNRALCSANTVVPLVRDVAELLTLAATSRGLEKRTSVLGMGVSPPAVSDRRPPYRRAALSTAPHARHRTPPSGRTMWPGASA